jgi:uncharacterized integral membrane protein (TIGR00697 family)
VNGRLAKADSLTRWFSGATNTAHCAKINRWICCANGAQTGTMRAARDNRCESKNILGFPHPNLLIKKGHIMYSFTAQQRFSALIWLSLFHIAIITSSNYLVQLPVSIFGFHTTWGAFTFPFIFLATDLTVRIFGAPLARRIILSVMVPALAISYVISALFFEAQWQGAQALSSLNIMVARIAIASFMAYVLGQILDVHVFNRLRQNRRWWIAPVASMFLGNISDTLSFFFIAFYKSTDAFMAQHWVEIAMVDYTFKVLICLVFFLPMYGMLLNMLLKRLSAQGNNPHSAVRAH